jgi:lysophospholipase L1-like esterase
MFSKVIDVIDTIERQGAKAIIVRPPSPWHWPYAHAFIRKYERECPQGPPLLDFGDPVKYPALYEGANRYDASHLNARGATVWSRLLADQIGELIQSGRLERPDSCRRAKT